VLCWHAELVARPPEVDRGEWGAGGSAVVPARAGGGAPVPGEARGRSAPRVRAAWRRAARAPLIARPPRVGARRRPSRFARPANHRPVRERDRLARRQPPGPAPARARGAPLDECSLTGGAAGHTREER